ncbi:MAG: hypothetical protein COA88_06370 [Kordia sp.]|nr:MAG: hypothetical protein COA88_06370 [Kordia sp.]
MKNLYSVLLVVLFTASSFAQAPQGFNYQSVVRDNLGNIIANTAVSLEFQLHQTIIAGAVVYTETHSVITSNQGVLSVVVGQGTTIDDFTTINWGNDSYFLETSIDATGGSTYVSLGTTQMMSVPYALTALRVETGNTLDEAYDEGVSAGDGRIISADAGRVKIVATGDYGLEITADPTLTGLYISGTTTIGQTGIYGYGSGDAYGIWGSNNGTASAVYATHNGVGEALEVSQTGAGKGVLITNTGTGRAIDIVNSNVVNTDNALRISHAGTGTAALINNAGTSTGLHVFNGNSAGTDEALWVSQAGSGDGVYVDNSGTGKGIEILNINTTTTETALFSGTMGLGAAGEFVIDDNNGNTMNTLNVLNMGAGGAAHFNTVDEITGKVNSLPTVRVTSNGKGPGIDISMINTEVGGDSNTEPGILSLHSGFGHAGYFKADNAANTLAAVEIINEGLGNGLHIESSYIPGINVGTSLSVEQNDLSFSSTEGRAAHFDLAEIGTMADSAVLITSAATDSGSSALRVIAASTDKLAGVFEGDVEISSDLTVGTTFVVPTATIGDLTVTTSISAPAKAFKIDHPLQPNDMFLLHNSIESNERVNIYSGNITTDNKGYYTVELPDYMSALNGDFKYQLTIMDKTFAQAIIWEEINIEDNTFIIKTNQSNIKVSWQVTGVRIDQWALDNPMKVEVAK